MPAVHLDQVPVLRLEALSPAVEGRPLVRAVDLDLAPGERVALAGPSGSGKTTLLRAVAGLIRPVSGRVLLRGETADHTGWPAFRRRVVLVAQQPALHEDSVEACLRQPFSYRSSAGEYPADRVRRLLDRLGLNDLALSQSTRNLSLGEQQRLCLVRALLVEPDVLLLDEPTSALDEDNAEAVERLVTERTTKHDLAALIVTHDRTQADRWCHRNVELQPLVATVANDAGRNDAARTGDRQPEGAD